MPLNLADNILSVNQNSLNSSEVPITTISNKTETNPANMDSAIENNDPNECNSNNNNNKNESSSKSTNQEGEQQSAQRAINESLERVDNGESIKNDNNNSSLNNNDSLTTEQKDDSSTFSTAFTISFGDDDSVSKKLSIKDSIRKFAPPKPHTIEKPRQSKSDQCQDNSLTSIESAPPGLSKHFVRKGNSNSSRSSSRKSNSSRHSNISESAAFLIDKMLNFRQDEGSESKKDKSIHRRKSPSTSSHSKKGSPGVGTNRMAHSSDNILDSEIDCPEDKSDNGTYIVGADPESDAARKKIDELFGVVKAAEASVIADSAKSLSNQQRQPDSKFHNIARLSRIPDKRSEHITVGNSSRSSSSSRHENSVTTTRQNQPRASSRHSRNSSCDRSMRSHHQDANSRPRRSISQSSRHSSNKELSDGDTRSSRSSLHNETERTLGQDNLLSNLPSMKFNRAFALRRARLGLGEPTRGHVNQTANYNQEIEPTQMNNVISSSQRRHQINTNTYKAANQSSGSSGSANFCRDDGGRYSLRMKNCIIPNRLNSAHMLPSSSTSSNRSPQHNALLDSYINKVSGLKISSGYTNILPPQQEQAHSPKSMPKHQSNDEPEPMSPSRYRLLAKAGRLNKKTPSELESDSDNYNRFNYSLSGIGEMYDSSYHTNESRACSSTGKKDSTLNLGALDSLVISAISSLSLKIRHSVCDVLVEHAKKLPVENETRLIVEEILPQLTADSSSSKSPTSIEEIDQSLYFDLAKTLKNLKKVEQMVDVIALISNQLPPQTSANLKTSSFNQATGNASRIKGCGDSTTTSEVNSNDTSPV